MIGHAGADTGIDRRTARIDEAARGSPRRCWGPPWSCCAGAAPRSPKGYPVKPARDGAPTPAAFAWTGTRRLFDAYGFKVVGNPDGGKQRVRKRLA